MFVVRTDFATLVAMLFVPLARREPMTERNAGSGGGLTDRCASVMVWYPTADGEPELTRGSRVGHRRQLTIRNIVVFVNNQ